MHPRGVSSPQELTRGELPVLLDVQQVARLLGCSQRHVFRLVESGQMPPPIKLRALVRWNRVELESWIAAGCPASEAALEKEADSHGL